MISDWVRRFPDAALATGFLLFFLFFGGGVGVWIQWRLERVFAQADPSGLTTPFIPLPE